MGFGSGFGPIGPGYPGGLWIPVPSTSLPIETPAPTAPPIYTGPQPAPPVQPPTPSTPATPVSPPSSSSPQPPTSTPPSEPISGEPVTPGNFPIHDYEGYDYGEGPQIMRFPARKVVIQEGEIILARGAPSVMRAIGRALGPIGAIIGLAIPSDLPPEPDVTGNEPLTPGASWPSNAPPQTPTTPAPEPPLERAPESLNFPATPDLPQPSAPSPTAAPTGTPSPLPSISIPRTSPQPTPRAPSMPWPLPAPPATFPRLQTPPAPTTFAQPTPTPTPTPIPTPSPTGFAPPLTPSNAAPVESPPGESCETPQQRKQRQQRRRDACEKFITVTIPRHKRRVCVSEAAKLARKKLVRYVHKEAGKLTKAGLRKLGLPTRGPARRPKRVRLPKVELPGGFEVGGSEIVKILKRTTRARP